MFANQLNNGFIGQDNCLVLAKGLNVKVEM